MSNPALSKLDRRTVDPAMSAAIRKRHFFTLWKHNADRSKLFECCNAVRKDCGLDPYSRQKFEQGWQYRVVMHKNYLVARDEFFNLVFGFW